MARGTPTHVWVDVTGKWSAPSPGLLLDWRRDRRGGWEGWVIRIESYSTGSGWTAQVVQSWVPAAMIRRAGSS